MGLQYQQQTYNGLVKLLMHFLRLNYSVASRIGGLRWSIAGIHHVHAKTMSDGTETKRHRIENRWKIATDDSSFERLVLGPMPLVRFVLFDEEMVVVFCSEDGCPVGGRLQGGYSDDHCHGARDFARKLAHDFAVRVAAALLALGFVGLFLCSCSLPCPTCSVVLASRCGASVSNRRSAVANAEPFVCTGLYARWPRPSRSCSA